MSNSPAPDRTAGEGTRGVDDGVTDTTVRSFSVTRTGIWSRPKTAASFERRLPRPTTASRGSPGVAARCRPNAAGRWPDEPVRGIRNKGGNDGADVFAARSAQGVECVGALASGSLRARRCAAGDHRFRRSDRCRAKGRQSRLLHLDRPAACGEDRQVLRGEISGRAVERTGAERVFQRIGQEYGSRIYAVDVVNSSDAAPLSPGSATASCSSCADDVAITASTGRAVRQLQSRHGGRSASTPVWCRPPTRPGALPICSIRNGRARWSRRIRATAAM